MCGNASWPSTRVSLLLRIREAHDHQAWCEFVDLYTPLIYHYCRRRGLQDADARDVTQEVFTRVGRSIRGFDYDPQRGKFRSWLGTVTRHELQRHVRRVRRTGQGAGGGLADLALSQHEAEEDADWTEEFNAHVFQAALERVQGVVAADIWQAFRRTWIENVKPRDVALEMSRKPEWVYKAKYKVLQRLRVEVDLLTSDLPGMVKRFPSAS